ncbi:hypothetical protein Tco_1114956, partial [Tanacetum coccineum]
MRQMMIKNPPLEQIGGSKSRHQSAGQSALAEEPIHTEDDFEELTHQEFETGANDDQPEDEIYPHPDCNLAKYEDPRESFDELMDTPLDFSAFVMNRLKVDTLTLELLVGLTFELMKGTCKSLVEIEYFFEEVYNATTEQLDWTNPDGQQYPHDLRKPLPLISNTRAMTNMLSGESHTGDENDNTSMDMRLIGNMQKMSIQDEESLRSQNFILSNGMATSI